MDLFGQNILDFPDEGGSLFHRLPRISESDYLPELGLDTLDLTGLYNNNKVTIDDDQESNDSAVYSDDITSDDASSEAANNNDDVGLLNDDEDSYLSAVAFDQICKVVEEKTNPASDNVTEPVDFIDENIPEDTVNILPSESIHFEPDHFLETYINSESPLDDHHHHDDASLVASSQLLASASNNFVPDTINQCITSSQHRPDEVLPLELSDFAQLHQDQTVSTPASSDFTLTSEDIDLGEKLLNGDLSTRCSLESLIAEPEVFTDGKISGDSSFKLPDDDLQTDLESEVYSRLDQFDFNLSNTANDSVDPDEESIAEAREVPSKINEFFNDFFAEINENTEEYDDFLNNILSDNNMEDFNNTDEDTFNIDAVDPSLIKQENISIKQEPVDEDLEIPHIVNVKKEIKEEDPELHSWLREHDYSLPPSSSLFLTPPHSPDHPHLVSKSHIVKFIKPSDLKFKMTLPVKKEISNRKVNPRSILKPLDTSVNKKTKSAKELVQDILEKRPKQLQEQREHVRNIKKRRREEETREPKSPKYACLDDLRTKTKSAESRGSRSRKYEEERELHNQMERQRREEMKVAYDCLKAVIPSIAEVEKVSKLNILNTARDYFISLEKRVKLTALMKQREEEKREKLLEKLNLLQLEMI